MTRSRSAANCVIVKTSANSDYGRTNEETSFREDETIALFEAMAAKIRAGN